MNFKGLYPIQPFLCYYSNMIKSKFLRVILLIFGSIFLALALIGIFLPLIPTTPFLLLTAACYARGSNRFYQWLMNNRLFGEYIKNYRENKTIPLRVKITALSMLWITILATAIFWIPIIAVKFILIGIAVGVTIHILRIKTAGKKEDNQD